MPDDQPSIIDPEIVAKFRADGLARQLRYLARHPEARKYSKTQRKIILGLVREALKGDGPLCVGMPAELVGLQPELPTQAEITMAAERNLEKAQRRVEKRRAKYQQHG